MVIAKVQQRFGIAPDEFGFDWDTKADVLYKFIMPKFNDILRALLMQMGNSNGFEFFRLLNRKIDPPPLGTTSPLISAPRSKALANTFARIP